MTDSTETTPEIQTNIPQQTPPAPKKHSDKIVWIIIICGLCLGCVLLAGVIFLVSRGATDLGKTSKEASLVIEEFIRHMESKEFDDAYDLFSPRGKKAFTVSDLEKLTEGNNFELYKDFDSILVTNFKATKAFNTNPDLPQGDVLTLDGTVIYSNDYSGTFWATLEKVDGEWKIYSIGINIPPNKVGNPSG